MRYIASWKALPVTTPGFGSGPSPFAGSDSLAARFGGPAAQTRPVPGASTR
ncbi:hypothetical protein [Streptomyces olivaceoviridis]|uniref:hypothetical protein n=1 Tax=Streptomyces olivaceoviridis TaxID=1921 RepID=UPI001677CAF6|nr:hypothetical protein [Streptomyces olivaceoviridis]